MPHYEVYGQCPNGSRTFNAADPILIQQAVNEMIRTGYTNINVSIKTNYMENKKPSEVLDNLRELWALRASFLEALYSKDDPIAKAIRMCIKESHSIQCQMQEYERKR